MMETSEGAAYPTAKLTGSIRTDVTVGENIDRQITELQRRIAELQAAKANLTGVLDMRIDFLQQAMRY